MEYIFGTIRRKGQLIDGLKTVGSTHTNLIGHHQVVREYSDSIITDTFDVKEHYLSKVDESGKCYDWYSLENHYRYIDKYTPNIPRVEERIDGRIDDTENALCESSEAFEESIAEIENAICELSEILEGGI